MITNKVLQKKTAHYLFANHYFRQLSNVIRPILRNLQGENIEFVTHEYPLSTSHEERFRIARNLLRRYATARLIITSRIHCALPCLGLGTPVILAVKRCDPLRYRGLASMFNHVWFDSAGHLETEIRYQNGEVVNPETFKPYAEALHKKCTDFARAVSIQQ